VHREFKSGASHYFSVKRGKNFVRRKKKEDKEIIREERVGIGAEEELLQLWAKACDLTVLKRTRFLGWGGVEGYPT